MEINIGKVNQIWKHLEDPTYKIILEQGGTRSGKTYTTLLWSILLCMRFPTIRITFFRTLLIDLRRTAIVEFIAIMKRLELYKEQEFTKSPEFKYTFPNGSVYEFFGADKMSKIAGSPRNVLIGDEANFLKSWALMNGLLLRTGADKKYDFCPYNGRVILLFNPFTAKTWIYDKLASRKDAILHVTTYKDNPMSSEVLEKEMEILKTESPEAYRVWGEGKLGNFTDSVYQNYSVESFEDKQFSNWTFGLDFGYNAPTALVGYALQDKRVYLKTFLYERGLTTPDLIERMRQLDISKKQAIYCDVEPDRIEELQRAGYNALKCHKGSSILEGVNYCKTLNLVLDSNDKYLSKEIAMYGWKRDRDGLLTDIPLKGFDHALDAFRYAVYSVYKENGDLDNEGVGPFANLVLIKKDRTFDWDGSHA